MQSNVRRLLTAAALPSLALLSACASFPELETRARRAEATAAVPSEGGAASEEPVLRSPPESIVIPAPAAPAGKPEATAEQIAALVGPEPVDVALPPQSIPQLLNTVFGEVLRLPYSLGPGVASRTEVVALRGAPRMTKQDFFRLTQVALRDYGLRVHIEGGTVTVSDGFAAQGSNATFIRGRGLATPTSGRPIIQFFDVRTVEVNALMPLINDARPPGNSAQITPDPLTNSLVIRGDARQVAELVRILREIDQPRFAGSRVLRVRPIYYGADALAEALERTLAAEGYAVTRNPTTPRGIILLPLPAAGQLLIFARDEELLARASEWVSQLDQPSAFGSTTTTFVYQVENTDAQSLGALLSGQGGGRATGPTPPIGVPGTPPATTAAANSILGQSGTASSPLAANAAGLGSGGITSGQFLNGRILIDPVSNRILFTGTANEFAQLRTLLATLDVAPRQVLVEVVIAEVTLTDRTRYGLDFFFRDTLSTTRSLSGGTEGGVGLSDGGINLAYLSPDLRVAFNAFASNSKVNILSRPRLVARSGGEAQIQVGTDIPIITSQRASDNQTGGDTDVLQSIQYRQTGVILNVKPVIYGDNRVDIEIAQEVSSQSGDAIPGIASPVILNRNVTTQISLQEGTTAVLGGLISDSYSKSNTGIPFLKDVPLVGQAFRSDTIDGDKTELLVLVTPYIIRDAEDMAAMSDLAVQDINAAFRIGRGWSYTLTPISLGPGIGLNLPETQPLSERLEERERRAAERRRQATPEPAL